MERDNARARTMKGWEQLIKTTASIVVGKELIVCNRAYNGGVRKYKMFFKSTEEGTRKIYID